MERKEIAKIVVAVCDDLKESVDTKIEIVDTILKVYIDDKTEQPKQVAPTPVPVSPVKPNVVKTTKTWKPRMHKGKILRVWTQEEDNYVMNEMSRLGKASSENFEMIANAIDRTAKAVENRYYFIKKKRKAGTYKTGTKGKGGTSGLKFKKRYGSKMWTAEEDKKLKEFADNPDTYFGTGYVKKTRVLALARELNRSPGAVRFRMNEKGYSLEHAKRIVKKSKQPQEKSQMSSEEKKILLKGLQREADKLKETHIIEKMPEFPQLTSTKVPKLSYMATLKSFTMAKGNKITIRDAFPLFGIDAPDAWENFLVEVMSKSEQIANALGVENRFAMVSTDEGRALLYQ